jgi:23S rRNA (cytidine1920-2'-O)/16S rRNA (cytidine1409-2'-O)-methyltransferase
LPRRSSSFNSSLRHYVNTSIRVHFKISHAEEIGMPSHHLLVPLKIDVQPPRTFVSRAGQKLEAALLTFNLNPIHQTCADLGANVGGFTDCLLQFGAAKVYAVDTAYGVLAWTLRKDRRVVVKDRTNALHVQLPEPVQFITIDVGWTRQEKILPIATSLLPSAGGDILTLIKPHYQSELAKTQRGILTPAQSLEVLWQVMDHIASGLPTLAIKGIVQSPLEGQKGNTEYIAWLTTTPVKTEV